MSREKIGQKLYKFINDELFMCRLIKVQNDNCFIVLDESNNKVKLTRDQYDSYTKLREDGIVVFSIVDLVSNTKNPLTNKTEETSIPDVIISFFRKEDLRSGIPYTVCRQNIYDIFTNAIENDNGYMHIGCSVSQDTCPENVKFEMLYACSKVNHSDMVAIYYEDDIDFIISLLKSTQPYDDVLYILSKGFNEAKVRGAQSTLLSLLKDNYFIEDVRRGFNIIKVNFIYKGNETFCDEFVHAIEDIIKVEMIAPVWVPFTRDIDLKKISDDYVLILDNNNDLYVVSYKRGNYINRPYAALKDNTEVDMLTRNLSSKLI